MDTGIITPLLLSLLAGSATGLGGLVVLCGPCANPSDKVIAFALAFAAGVMTIVSFVDLWWPLARVSTSAFGIASTWFIVGAVLARLFQYLPVPEPEALVITGFGDSRGSNWGRLPGGDVPSNAPHSAAAKRISAWRLGFLLVRPCCRITLFTAAAAP